MVALLTPSCQTTSKKFVPAPVHVHFYVPDVEKGVCEFTNAEDKSDVVTPISEKWARGVFILLEDLEAEAVRDGRWKDWE
jgi:hypothetical protein